MLVAIFIYITGNFYGATQWLQHNTHPMQIYRRWMYQHIRRYYIIMCVCLSVYWNVSLVSFFCVTCRAVVVVVASFGAPFNIQRKQQRKQMKERERYISQIPFFVWICILISCVGIVASTYKHANERSQFHSILVFVLYARDETCLASVRRASHLIDITDASAGMGSLVHSSLL